ncbi:MAG: hypothetical protein GY853_02195 [PVC group bacterium]|nr:hypothetical protein [PVC group bacterium]
MNNPFDLNKYFPNYFNKWVFRYAVLCIILLFIFTADSNNWRNEFIYVTCPEGSHDGCWVLKNQITNNEKFPDRWDGTFLSAGETLGEKPNDHYFKFKLRTWRIILSAFLFNHLLFMLNTKKLYPKKDLKKVWGKIKK